MQPSEVNSVNQLKTWVGKETGLGQWVTVSQEMVNKFADATGDHQYIHVEPERAAETMFGGTIAHGFLTLSLLAGFLAHERQGVQLKLGEKLMVNYGMNKVRFMSHVSVGKRIRARARLQNVTEDPDKKWVQVLFEQTVEIEGALRPAMVAETITRLYW